MILIFSQRVDLNTRIVLAYLNYFNEDFEVFLEDDSIELEYVIEDKKFDYEVFKNRSFVCHSSEIKSVWYRRTDIQVSRLGSGVFTQEGLETYAKNHIKTRYEQIQKCLHTKRCLGKFGFGNFNKIEFLETCASLNIEIPKTLITGSKKKLMEFWKACNYQAITKSLAAPFEYIEHNDLGEVSGYRLGYTVSVDKDTIEILPDRFDLSLFQEKLDKQFEIRTIYINKKTFSQAIFSQSRESASLDYRLGYDSGMRLCNYTLPPEIEDQVQQLMDELDLNFGSIDMVVTKENNYVFLEINPNGQYGAVSEMTNSNVDFEVAKFLIS